VAGPAIQASFRLQPQRALEFFRSKGLRASFAWQDVFHEEHDANFVVAKMMDLDLLADVRSSLDRALAEGKTFRQFRDELEPELVRRGWWGRAEMRDPATGEIRDVQLGSPRRLRTIYDTNLRTSYAAGHWAAIEETRAAAPYLMYVAVDDDRTRPEHAAWNGTVLPADDPWWQTHYPPNGWNCRCSVVQLSRAQLERLGLEVDERAPASPTREWTNPRTGVIEQVPEGIDPGWAYSPGRSRRDLVVESVEAKAASWPPEFRDAIRDAIARIGRR
jgi:SPP1 gp7 family putative phage head morphogenesis protein